MLARRNRYAYLLVMLAGLMLAPVAAAEEFTENAPGAGAPVVTDDSDTLEVAIDLAVFSKYVWRGVNAVDDPVFQPNVDFSYLGFNLFFWGNLELTDINDNRNKFTEVDIGGSYSFALGDFNLEVGGVGYIFPQAGVDTFELLAGVEYDCLLSPGLTVYQDIDFTDGTYIVLSGGHAFEDPFKLGEDLGLSPEVTASIAWGSGDHNEIYYGVPDSGFADLTLGLSIPVNLNKSVALAASFYYSSLLDGDIRDATSKPDNFWFGLTLTVAF